MKLLFDQNISFRIIKKIQADFPHCTHVSDCSLNNRNDREIWEYAKSNDYTIVTFDADFYDISMIEGIPPKIIWIRTGNMSTEKIIQLLIGCKMSIINFHQEESKFLACLEINKS